MTVFLTFNDVLYFDIDVTFKLMSITDFTVTRFTHSIYFGIICPLLPCGLYICPLLPCDLYICPLLPCSLYICPLLPCGLYICPLLPCGLYICPLLPCDLYICPLLPCDLYICPLLPCDLYICPLLPCGLYLLPLFTYIFAAILLGHLRRPVSSIRSSLYNMDETVLTAELLKQMLVYAPDATEVCITEERGTFTCMQRNLCYSSTGST